MCQGVLQAVERRALGRPVGAVGARMRLRRIPSSWRTAALLLVVALLATACGGSAAQDTEGETAIEAPADAATSPTPVATDEAVTSPTPFDSAAELSGTLRLYSSVTQETVAAVLDAYAEQQPDVEVELFRAPTGELASRLAAEQREGEILADVLWLTDPLSMQAYAAQDLLRDWTPEEADALTEEHREERFWGTRLLNLVVVHPADLEDPPTSWDDLLTSDWEKPIALPDPGFAGSAFGALAYFGLDPAFGFDFYRRLRDAGAVQVQAPGDVVTGVAEGRYSAGITLDNPARSAIDRGAPIEMVFPEPGAIALYSPIAVIAGTEKPALAESFASFSLTLEAQEAIAATGWQPIRDDVAWPSDGPTVTPDWTAAFDRQDDLLEKYRSVFRG